MDGVTEVGGVALARVEDDEDTVSCMEGAQVLTLLVVVQAEDIPIEPHIPTTKRRISLRQETDRMDLSLSD